jgi:hypothetical protein
MLLQHDDRGSFLTDKTSVRNRRKRSVRFRVEPWGEEYQMPSGATFHVSGRGPDGEGIFVEWGDESVTVYAWPGASLHVSHRGVDVGPSERLTAPRIPSGMTLREWVAAVKK